MTMCFGIRIKMLVGLQDQYQIALNRVWNVQIHSFPPCRLGLLPKRTAVVFLQELATSKGKELECLIAENLGILENESFHCPHIVTNQTIFLLV
jgi:hypothetical protein